MAANSFSGIMSLMFPDVRVNPRFAVGVAPSLVCSRELTRDDVPDEVYLSELVRGTVITENLMEPHRRFAIGIGMLPGIPG